MGEDMVHFLGGMSEDDIKNIKLTHITGGEDEFQGLGMPFITLHFEIKE